MRQCLRQQELKDFECAVIYYNRRNYEFLLTYFRTGVNESVEKLLKMKYVSIKSQLWQNQLNAYARRVVPSFPREGCLISLNYSARHFERTQMLNGITHVSVMKALEPSLNQIVASYGRLRLKLRNLLQLNLKQIQQM